jgi:hypothetical protein
MTSFIVFIWSERFSWHNGPAIHDGPARHLREAVAGGLPCGAMITVAHFGNHSLPRN